VVGAVYKDTCSLSLDPDPIQVINPLQVKEVSINDMGGGILKVSARGTFLAQGFSVMSGPNVIPPTTFDGTGIEFFANAATLLMDDNLKLVDENGKSTLLGMKPPVNDPSCSIVSESVHAVPRPDGNSLVEAKILTGMRYKEEVDKAPNPLFLIGTQVYGLHETPFLEPPSSACSGQGADLGVDCTFHFLAPTDTLRAAQNFKIRDLAWTQLRASGKIEFDPSFTSLALLATNPPAKEDNSAPTNTNPKPSAGNHVAAGTGSSAHGSTAGASNSTASETKLATVAMPPIYTLAGNDLFAKLASSDHWNCDTKSDPKNPKEKEKVNCLDVYQGLSRFILLKDENFQVTSKTTAVISFTPAPDNPALTPMPTIQIDENN
jgi:hypothetical protein